MPVAVPSRSVLVIEPSLSTDDDQTPATAMATETTTRTQNGMLRTRRGRVGMVTHSSRCSGQVAAASDSLPGPPVTASDGSDAQPMSAAAAMNQHGFFRCSTTTVMVAAESAASTMWMPTASSGRPLRAW